VDAAPPPAPEPSRGQLARWLTAWRWPLVALAIAALVVALAWRVVVSIENAGRAAAALPGAAAERLSAWARGLLTGDVTRRFLVAVPTLSPMGSGNLEVAVAESVESISRTDERRAFWDLLSLGTTTVEIRVPVTYRYHLRFDDRWKVTVADGVCRVAAPALRPSLPPAIHTDRMERRVDESWLRFDGAAQLAALESTLTPELSRLARDRRHLALVRESARGTVARFARGWLMTEGAWDEERVRAIVVTFADEPAAPAPVPTLVLGD
jgi:hypothetical protein